MPAEETWLCCLVFFAVVVGFFFFLGRPWPEAHKCCFQNCVCEGSEAAPTDRQTVLAELKVGFSDFILDLNMCFVLGFFW